MPTVAHELDAVQRFLGDAAVVGDDGALWTRAELLTYYADAYRAFLTESQAVRRWVVLDVPPRFTYTGTQPWEARYAQGGTFWHSTWMAPGGYACEFLWEVQVLEGIAGHASSPSITQHWERQYVNPTHQYTEFALPRDQERIVGLWFDHRRLHPVAVRTLDSLERAWMSLDGYPLVWTVGLSGQGRNIAIYAIPTVDAAGYQLTGGPWGIPRRLSGARTYAPDPVAPTPWGLLRRIVSPERQYLATTGQGWGVARAWHTSVGNLLILEVVGPDVPDLGLSDSAALLPPQMRKYLRYYVLMRAWMRQGEGYQPELAALCQQVYAQGVRRMRGLAWLTRHDDVMARQPATRDPRRPARAQLPATYPRVD